MPPSVRLAPVIALLLAIAAHGPSPAAVSEVSTLLERTLPADSLRALGLQYAGKRDSALALVSADRARWGGSPDARVRMRVTQIEGTVRANAGDPAGAVPLLTSAIRMAEARRDTASLIRSLRFRAYAYGSLGQLELDRVDATRMLTLARRTHDRRAEPYALSLLGWLERAGGRFGEARRLLLQAILMFREQDNTAGEAYTLVSLGSAEMALGRYDDARRTYRRSLELGTKVPLAWAEPQALNDLGVAETAVGDWGRAMDYFARAYRTQVARGQLRDAVMSLDNFVESKYMVGAGEGASDLVRDAIAQCERAGLRSSRANLLSLLGAVEHDRGREQEARRALRAALAAGDTLEPLARSTAAFRLSRVLIASDSLATAVPLLREELARSGGRVSLATELEMRLQYGYALRLAKLPAEARTQLELVVRRARTAGIASMEQEAATQLGLLEDDLGRTAEGGRWLDHATEVWEKRRIVNSRAIRELDLTFGGAALGCQSAYHHLVHDPPATAAAAAFDVLQRFRARTLFERAAGLRALGASDSARFAPRYLGLTQLQGRILRPGELFVEFDFGPNLGLLSVVTTKSCRVLAIPGADSLARVTRLGLDLLSDPSASIAGANAVLAPLALRIFGGISGELRGAREVTLVAGGPLQGLPLEALITSLTTPSLQVTRVPSATLLDLVRRHAAPAAGHRPMLALAGGGAQPRATLEGARREVHALASRYADMRELRGDSPGAPADVAALARFGLLHFAGHSRAESARPWRSGFVVRAAADPDDEIVLRAEDIVRQPLNANFVALSSCASADSRTGSAEGMTSLTGAFLAAGARAVLATLWDVDDASTERFMLAFYGRLARNEPAAAALGATREEFRRRPETALPFFWAGYVLTGEGSTRVPLTEKSIFPGRRGH